jgi:hypothetical protein
MSRLLGSTVILELMGSTATASAFKYYPDATLYTPPDTEANRQFTDALGPGVTIRAWLTHDTFEQVVGFYRAIGKEFKPPNGLPADKLPGGQVIHKTFVTFDGAPDLVTSREWIRVQHPFIGPVSRAHGAPQYQDVRDLTEIVLTERKPVPKQHEVKPQS